MEVGATVVVTVVVVTVVEIESVRESTSGVGVVETVTGATVRDVGNTTIGLPVVAIGAGKQG